MTRFLEDLPRRAAQLGRSLVLPEGEDPRVLEAAARLVRERIARPVLLGEPEHVRRALEELDADPEQWSVHDTADADRLRMFAARYREAPGGRAATVERSESAVRDPLVQATLMVRGGEVDGCVAGCVRSTSDVLRAALRCVGPAPGVETVSSAFYMSLPPRAGEEGPVLTFTDAAVVPNPTAEQLAQIALAAARARRLVVGDEPRVAFLSYSTHGSDS